MTNSNINEIITEKSKLSQESLRIFNEAATVLAQMNKEGHISYEQAQQYQLYLILVARVYDMKCFLKRDDLKPNERKYFERQIEEKQKEIAKIEPSIKKFGAEFNRKLSESRNKKSQQNQTRGQKK